MVGGGIFKLDSQTLKSSFAGSQSHNTTMMMMMMMIIIIITIIIICLHLVVDKNTKQETAVPTESFRSRPNNNTRT